MTNPYAIKLRDGRVVDNLDFANAAEQVRQYGATWGDYDAALSAVSAERDAHRQQRTVNAKESA